MEGLPAFGGLFEVTTPQQLLVSFIKKVIFICGKNKWRSPTAEVIFSGIEGYEVLSAGLNNDAVERLTPELVSWAEHIFVMEKAHKSKLRQKYSKYIKNQKIVTLDIPDKYQYMDMELVAILNKKLSNFFNINY